MTKNNFKGLMTALVTPFDENCKIDYMAMEQLIGEQTDACVNGIVILGTTGESPTISSREFEDIVKFAVKTANKKTKVIVGSGTNDTAKSIKTSKLAQGCGADAILAVNPYYNRPSQSGLYQHFTAIADNVDIPVILYNIKGRTAINLETPTLLKLANHPNICGVKEASGDMLQIMDVIAKAPEGFTVISGDDVLTYPLMALGGHGIISVISNILPKEMMEMVTLLAKNQYEAARKIHFKIHTLMHALLSVGVNPMPVKTILAHLGKIKEVFRLPLCPLEPEQKQQLLKIWNEYLNEPLL